jgi:2-oxo-4-hydroxy-4-carboxy-5-ureidoimidazoline decarboxylase
MTIINSLRAFNEASSDTAYTWFRDEIVESVLCDAWIHPLVQQKNNRPYTSFTEFLHTAEHIWRNLSKEERITILNGHPEIGKVEATAYGAMEAAEQQGMIHADPVIAAQIEVNKRMYKERFGFIYMIYATGKSATELATALELRLQQSRAQELATATTEFWKIHEKRLRDKLSG